MAEDDGGRRPAGNVPEGELDQAKTVELVWGAIDIWRGIMLNTANSVYTNEERNIRYACDWGPGRHPAHPYPWPGLCIGDGSADCLTCRSAFQLAVTIMSIRKVSRSATKSLVRAEYVCNWSNRHCLPSSTSLREPSPLLGATLLNKDIYIPAVVHQH